MSTLIQQIAALRTSLREADGNDLHSFSHVFDAFFDISDGSNLMGISESVEAPLVLALLESTARRHLRDPRFSLTMIQILHHVPSDLFHGGFLAGPITGTFFYFPADQQGLVAFNDGSPMTHFYRITATVLPARGMPMPRPAGKQ
jgi:hypothetical protein